jgi:hypothetical protein
MLMPLFVVVCVVSALGKLEMLISEAVLCRDSERGRRKLAPVKEKVSAPLSSVKSSWAQSHSAVVCAAMVVEVLSWPLDKIVVWEDFGLTGFRVSGSFLGTGLGRRCD